MNDNQPKPIQPLSIISARELMNTDYPPLSFTIDKILPQGIFILAGSGKIGKSWLSLDMCVAVANGGSLWEFKANEGEVLYLALEDTHPRLKGRLERITAEHSHNDKLHLAISSLGITDGLIQQVKDFIAAKPTTRLIVIDTLERIRNSEQDKSMYSCDYRDINRLREILDGNTVTLLLVHHTRKMYDPDPLNTLSGSTGLVGAVDGVWVLEKEKRTEGKGKLTIANRDTEGYCFKVEFDKANCRWNFIGIDDGKITSETDENFCYLIGSFINEQWQGTATQLVDYLKQMDSNLSIDPRSISRKLESVSEQLKSNYGIDFKAVRTGKSRNIYLSRTAQMTI